MKILSLLEKLIQTQSSEKEFRGRFKGHPNDVHRNDDVLGKGLFLSLGLIRMTPTWSKSRISIL